MVSKATIKFVQSLKIKKYRLQNNAFVAEGNKLVAELFNSNMTVLALFGTDEWISEMEPGLRNFDGEITAVSTKELQRLSFLKNPQQALAVCEIPDWQTQQPSAGEWCFYLDDISDPGNLGTIIRTADWFGYEAIYCSPESVDVYNPKVVQATMGSIARVKVVYRPWKDFEPSLQWYAAAMQGKSIYDLDDAHPGMIVIGNEAHGVNQEILNNASPITIPKKGMAESLNAAMATGIIMSEVTKK